LLSSCGPSQPRLRVVMGLGEAEWQVMRQEIFPAFEKEAGVRIEAVQMEAGDLPQVLEAQVKAGRVKIDLFAQDNMQLSYLVNKGLVEDLSEHEKDIPQTAVPSLVDAGRFSGRLYFMPYRPNVQIVYYNRHKFDAYQLELPEDWEDLLHVATVFKVKEGRGKVLFKAYGGAPTATQLYEWIVSAGGDPYTLNDEGCVETFTFLQELWPHVSADSIRAKFDTSNEYMARDSAYLMQNWPFGIRVIVEEYAKTDIETYHGFSGPKREAHVIGGEVLGIPKGAKNRELALRFIQYLQSREVQSKLAKELGWPSMRSDAYDEMPGLLKERFQAVNEAMAYGVLRRNVAYWDDYVKYVNDAFTRIVIRGEPVKETLDLYHERLEEAKRRM